MVKIFCTKILIFHFIRLSITIQLSVGDYGYFKCGEGCSASDGILIY